MGTTRAPRTSYFDISRCHGVDPGKITRRRGGVGKSLGNGHAVIQSEPPWGRPIARWVPAFGEAKRGELAALQQELAERFGSDWAYQMTQTSRNL